MRMKMFWKACGAGLMMIMLNACGSGSGNNADSIGSERPKAFDEMFEHVDAFYKTGKEQGRKAAEAMNEEFWKQHPIGSLAFSPAIEEGLPLTDLQLEFRGGSNYNNGIPLMGNVKATGDNVPDKVFLVCYKDGQPVIITKISLSEKRGDSYLILTSMDVTDYRYGIVKGVSDFDRIILQKESPDQTLVGLARNGVKITKETVIFSQGKLGPVTVGSSIGELPQQVEGLYDKFTHETIEHEDEMDGPWTEDYYLFTKGGEDIFRANIADGKVYSIRFLTGSSFIVTPAGFHVGMPALDLVNRIRMVWATDYDGEVYASSENYTYYVSSDDINGDFPTKIEDFKEGAKLSGIVYHQ